MKRIDLMEARDDGQENLVCGIVLHSGKLQYSEGNSLAARQLLDERFTLPNGVTVTARQAPVLWIENARVYLSSYAAWVTEPIDEEDSLYDMATGMFVGDAENPPLYDESLEESGLESS